jgi:hypothetical protein
MVKARVAPAAELLEDVMRTSSTGIFGSSVMAASLDHLPFPRRRLGTMPMISPPASFAPAIQSGKVLSGSKQGPSLKRDGAK